MLSKTLCANTALAEPGVREATTLVNHCAAVLVSPKVFASRASWWAVNVVDVSCMVIILLCASSV